MPKGMQPIFKQTVGAGNASAIHFNNIPQTFTDLKIYVYGRTNRASVTADNFLIAFNDDNASTNYSSTFLYSTGSGGLSTARTINSSTIRDMTIISADGCTTGVFGICELEIKNYKDFKPKMVLSMGSSENNAAGNYTFQGAGHWRGSAPITKISLYPQNGSFFYQNSTFTLYGIAR